MNNAGVSKANQQTIPMAVSIASGKGGVGKSSIALNLAISLAKTGARVCLFDADTGLANINILLGLTPRFSLEHVLFGAKSIDDIMLDGPHGIKIVPGAHGIGECVDLHPRQQLRLTRELSRIEHDFDFLLVDTAAGISSTTLDFVSAAQHTIIVITPEPTSLTDAFSLVKLLHRRPGSNLHFHVVVNMCSSTGQAKEIYHRYSAAVAKYIGADMDYLGFILRDESMRAAVSLQSPVAMFPDSDPSSRSFIRLADSLLSVTRSQPAARSFSQYWQRQYRARAQQRESHLEQKSDSPKGQDEKRDRLYLSELKSRLLLLIEKDRVDEDTMKELIQELIAAHSTHFGGSPLDMIEMLEQLLLSPDRNDQLLREMYRRIKPWGSDSEHVPPRPSFAAGDVFESPMPEAAPALQNTERPAVSRSKSVEVAAAGSGPQYDAGRFGSQQHLLALLQRRSSEHGDLAALLESLA